MVNRKNDKTRRVAGGRPLLSSVGTVVFGYDQVLLLPNLDLPARSDQGKNIAY